MIDVSVEDKELVIRWLSVAKGLDSKSSPISIQEHHVPDLQNVDLPGGVPTRMDGATIYESGTVQSTIDSLGAVTIDSLGALTIDSLGTSTSTADIVYPGGVEPTLFAQYRGSTGTLEYLAGGRDGHVRRWDGNTGAFVSLRRDLSTADTTWWSWTRLADYVIASNRVDGTFKYDGTRFIPLGAKHIADFESTETWAGSGSADTTNIKQGTQGRQFTSTGAAVSGTRTPSPALDLTDGLLEARDYTTSDEIHFWLYLDAAANLDTTNTFIRFGNSADTVYFQLPASAWATGLLNGWNEISVLKSAFTDVGGANWNNIAKVTIQVDSTGATTVNATFDDLYMIYADNFPGVQVLGNFLNMVLGGRSTADPSSIHFARANAPDDYSSSASFLIDENDGFEITGIGKLYNQAVIFKGHSVNALTGDLTGRVYPSYALTVTHITSAHGCSSHRSIVEWDNNLFYWFQAETGGEIYRYNGLKPQKLSYWIDPTLAATNATEIHRAMGGLLHEENQIFWWYPPTGSAQNSGGIRYDYVLEAFIPTVGQTVALVLQAVESGQERLLTIGYTGRVLRQNSGTSFDGTAITAFVTSPWLSAKRPESIKEWLESMANYQTNTGNLIVEYRIADHPRQFDAATFTTAATIDQSVTGEYGRLFLGDQSRWIQFRLRSVGAEFSVYMPFTTRAVDLARHV